MDIIPIIPASQQGHPAPSIDSPAGNGEPGFDAILNQKIPAPADSGLLTSQPTKNKHHTSSPLFDPDQRVVLLNDETASSNGSPQLVNISADNNHTTSNRGAGQFSEISTKQPEHLPTTAAGLTQELPLVNQWTISADHPDLFLGGSDQAHQADLSMSALFDSNSAERSFKPDELGGNLVENLASPDTLHREDPAADFFQAKTFFSLFSLELHSTASAFSVKSRQAAAFTISRQSTSINVDIGIPSPIAQKGQEATEPKVFSILPGTGAPAQLRSAAEGTHAAAERLGPFFETISTSIFPKDQPNNVLATGQSIWRDSSILLQELQKLITQSDDLIKIEVPFEPGVTSTKDIGYLFRQPALEAAGAHLGAAESIPRATGNSLLESVLLGPEISQQSKTEQLRDGLREKINDPLLNPKTDLVGNSNERGSNQNLQHNMNSSSNNLLQQQAATVVQNSSSLPADQSAGNGAFSSQFHDIGSPQIAETAKTSATPSPHLSLVRDHEIINQLVERFTSQTRLQTSRLSLQLHPAELGEVKIDVIVKGDVLKANIYAQTHQAGELIDRNIARLREILQDQGLSVSDLVVSFKSDTIDDYSSQHGQLYQDQARYSKQPDKPTSTSLFETEGPLVADQNDPSGVNLTI